MECPVHRSRQAPPLLQNGHIRFQARHVGYILTSLFTLTSVVASTWLVHKHLRWYSCKPQQRHIVRLLFMVPIYAIITLASYLSLSNATSLLLIRDAYESVVLASFFSLLLEYLAGPRHPDPPHTKKHKKGEKGESEREQLDSESVRTGEGRLAPGVETVDAPLSKAERATVVHKVFYRVPMHRGTPKKPHKPLKWIFPLGSIRTRPKDGLSYLHWMKWGVLQYCIVRPGSTLAAVILQQFNLYCESSWNWRWGHVYVVTIVSVSVTVAMYCLIQLYTTISKELKPYSPLLKLFAVKAVVFLTFWQSALLSGLASLEIIKDTEYMTAQDIVVGFSALLQTFEMMCFAFLHVKAFSYVPYKRIARLRAESSERGEVGVLEPRSINPDMPPLLSSPARPSIRHLPAGPKQQVLNLVQAFTFTDTWRDLRAGVLYFFGRGASREADDVCRREERFREVFGRERQRDRSFMRVGGYKGLPQEEDKYLRTTRPIPGLSYSPLPTPPQDEYDDAPPMSLVRTRESDDTVREYVAQRLEYAPRVDHVAPAPPPRGAYVPAHGPGPSWSGVITPPRTPVFVVPGGSPGLGSPSHTPAGFPSHIPNPTSPQPTSSTRGPSRRIGDVYVGGTRGGDFVPRDIRPVGVYALPRPEGFTHGLSSPISPRSVGTPISPRSAASPPRSAGTYDSRSEGVGAGPTSPRPKGSPRSPGTHISPGSVHVLAQTSPLFQQSFSPDAQAYPLSPVSPPLLRVLEDLAPRTSGETQRTQRNSGFTLPHWASGTPTHSQWPSDTPNHSQWPSGVTSSRRTSANTMPPSPTRGRRMSVSEDVEPPSGSRDDSLLGRVFSAATRTTDRTRDSARTSVLSLRTGECPSSSNGSETGTNEGASVQPARAVSFRSGAPVLVRLGERRDSISSPSLVSSSFGDRRESDPSTPSSASSPTSAFPYTSLPSPPEVARPLRRMSANLQLRVPRGPRTQPRTVTLPTPLSPARYPHSPWRPTITRSSGLAHVSSVRPTVSHWNPLRPPSTSSVESGLAGRGAGRSSVGVVVSPGPEYTAMSSLSSLSNSDDRYPTAPRRDS
ncbi:organic solute transporter Ostalpha-domain-containing protein [Rhizoctonia solani]|nr:organic solute transporter Ostalpha-domain-containing protein [Rhizoctonia solani]